MDGNFNNYTQQGNYIPPQKESAGGLAIAAFVCGIVGFVLQIWPCSLAAIIMGNISRKNPADKVFATIGMCFGIAQTVIFLLGLLLGVGYVIFIFGSFFLVALGSM